MANTRNYHCKDVEMLIASRTIAMSFKAHISELSVTRPAWTAAYADDLAARIDSVISSNLGTDARKGLRGATASLMALEIPAKKDLSFFKLQVSEDFSKDLARRDEILRLLGFSDLPIKISLASQEELVQLLFEFKTNMTEALRGEIIGKGISPVLIDNILGYAENFAKANVAQESAKGSAKLITGDMVDAFNAIHGEIMGICKIASAYYSLEPDKKEFFSFSRVLANMGGKS